jgi:hypothetical protein
MIYGLLNLKNVEEPGYCVVTDLPRGTGLDRVDAAKPSVGEPVADVWPDDAYAVMSKKLGGMQLPDIVSNTWTLLIVHARVKEIIEAVNRGPTEYLPLAIRNHKNRVASKDYFVVNPLHTYDVVDVEASTIKWFEGDVVEVEKYVLDPYKVKNAPDLFRPNEVPEHYFISKRIASRLRELDPPNTNRRYIDAFDIKDV